VLLGVLSVLLSGQQKTSLPSGKEVVARTLRRVRATG